MPELTRRDALKNLAGLGAVALAGETRLFAAETNPIREENARSGTRDWILVTPSIDPSSKYRVQRITQNILKRMRRS